MWLIINGDGTIIVDSSLHYLTKYKKLNGTKVAWASKIDEYRMWPTSSGLNFRNELPPVTSRHRAKELGYDDDSDSVDSQYEYENNERVCLEFFTECALYFI